MSQIDADLIAVLYGPSNVCYQGHTYHECNGTDVIYYNCGGEYLLLLLSLYLIILFQDPPSLAPLFLTFSPFLGVGQCQNCNGTAQPIVNLCEGVMEMECSTSPPKNPFTQYMLTETYDTRLGCNGTIVYYSYTKLKVFYLSQERRGE